MYEVNLSITTIDTATYVVTRRDDAGLLEYYFLSITAAVERSTDNCDRLIRWLPLLNVVGEK